MSSRRAAVGEQERQEARDEHRGEDEAAWTNGPLTHTLLQEHDREERHGDERELAQEYGGGEQARCPEEP